MLIVSLLLAIGGLQTAAATELWEWTGPTMGTRYSVKLIAPAEIGISQDDLAMEVDRLLREVNDQMSTYLADSEISRFNRAAAGEWFAVSPATAQVVAEALEIGRKSHGAYDITVGPLVRLWQFGAPAGGKQDDSDLPTPKMIPPEPETIQAVLEDIGQKHLQVRTDPPALRKEVAGLEIDLSSIAKGYAVDRVAELFEGHGAVDYMVEIGGEVRVGGIRPDGKSWQIGIERPTADRREVERIVPLRNQAMATSGDYRNFFEYEGRRYSHLIDPRTGRPVEHNLGSVTVLADRCAEADALATTLLVLGPKEGLTWATEHDVAALLITRRTGADGSVELVEQPTPRYEKLVGKPTEGAGWATTLLFTIGAFALVMLLMALGVLLSGRCLRGSCGGLAGLRDAEGRPMCENCSRRTAESEDESHSEE